MDDDQRGQTTLFDVDVRHHARATDPETSHAAAARLSDKATMLAALLAAYRDGGPMTAEEAADFVGYSAVDCAWKRVSDLERLGYIRPTDDPRGGVLTRPGRSGRAQMVRQITSSGREALR